ncbi:DUF2807 domain-containing protein [Cellulophaga sp. F20128]|uniref:head GIN domain-containing protein n=1 Tax=Cellulophaga sp. F20128 TaxID=2926413 RepID=UPI001FF41B71|nr:head GIN domain-containing protein [Cellulophaga sp. F20128]MCK0156043.1 DUF2807 domain-containing protein [Cellulophaga sp. F20128]
MKIMNRLVLFFGIAIGFLGCNSEHVSDCFQNAGAIMREEISVPDFSKIIVFENIELIVKQGLEQKVEVETGEFLRNDISAVVEDGRLVLRNSNACNFTREYGITKFYITSPNITEIRSSTGLDISSDGVLTYNSLVLVSESFNNPETDSTSGLFNLEIQNTTVSIVSNGLAYFKLNGSTENFNITFAAGDSRLSAENLVAQNVRVNHRSSNDMLVNPQVAISGEIRGTGDVISFTEPPSVTVTELYKGRLIFRN